MRRIGMLAFTLYPIDPRVRREAEALADRGDEVELICLRRTPQPRRAVEHGVDVTRFGLAHKAGRGGTVRYLWQYLVFFVYCSLVISWRHLRRRYDLIQVHTMPDFLVFAAALPKLFGARVLLDVHDLMPELFCTKFGTCRDHPLIRLITWVERLSVRFADGAIAVHERHLDVLVSHGNPRGRFVILLNVLDERLLQRSGPAPVTKPEARPQAGSAPFQLIYHGTLDARYGLDMALRAMARLEPRIADLRFLIVGQGGNLDELVRLAAELKLRGVHFSRALIPLERLIPVIRQADLGIIPIRVDGFTDQTIPTKLLEYVALGLPVVTSRLKAVERYFSDDMVRYFRSGDEEDLALQILDLYHHPEKRRRLAARGAAFTDRYNWKTQMRTYYELVDGLLAPKAGRPSPERAKKKALIKY